MPESPAGLPNWVSNEAALINSTPKPSPDAALVQPSQSSFNRRHRGVDLKVGVLNFNSLLEKNVAKSPYYGNYGPGRFLSGGVFAEAELQGFRAGSA
jgi:hypothetical protein